jgi:hypothetical protein
MKSFNSLIPFLPFLLNHLRLPSPELYPIPDTTLNFASASTTEHFFVTTLHGPAENTASIVKEARLLIRCQGMDVLLLRALAPAGMCFPSRCLAMGIYVTICSYLFVLYSTRPSVNQTAKNQMIK